MLISTSGYVPERDEALLRELLRDKIELFCAVGADADKWEDAIDWLSLGDERTEEHFVATTQHSGESVADVIEFATQFATESAHEVEVIRV